MFKIFSSHSGNLKNFNFSLNFNLPIEQSYLEFFQELSMKLIDGIQSLRVQELIEQEQLAQVEAVRHGELSKRGRQQVQIFFVRPLRHHELFEYRIRVPIFDTIFLSTHKFEEIKKKKIFF